MASRLGMAIRNQKANDRIDDALARLATGQAVPDAPSPVRDPILRDTLRLEWIADAVESVAAQAAAPKSTTKQAAKAPAKGGPA